MTSASAEVTSWPFSTKTGTDKLPSLPQNLTITQIYCSGCFSELRIIALPSLSHFSLEDFGAERRQVCAET